jgi:TRAP-type C4-dicarboxylate transport system permease small subunit
MSRISDLIDTGTKIVLVIVLSLMAIVVFLQVIFRYLVHFPLFWTEEFARYCLVWASLLGAGVAFKQGQHIAVTYFLDRFAGDRKRKLMVGILADFFIAVILVVVFWGGLELVRITRHQLSPALQIPMSYPYLAVPIGSAIMFIHLLAESLLKWKELSQAFRRR